MRCSRMIPASMSLVVLLAVGAARAEDAAAARAGLGMASAAADAWADDARLVWIENDTALDAAGRAAQWGYLYYSPEKHAMRSWSVREAHIVAAVDHTVSAEAPALDAEWQDSDAIATRAWDEGGREFCAAGGTLVHLLLVRGVFAPEPAWCAVFDRGQGPSLYVLLDAKSGDVQKRWRG